MSIFFRSALFTAVLGISVALLAGCGSPKYLIKGLTLPAGSTVKFEDDTTDAADMGMAGMGARGTVEQAVAVSFDSNLDWAGVSGHVGRCLSGQGFKDSSGILKELGGLELPAEVLKMFAGTIKVWASPEGDYFVELVNNAQLRSLTRGMVPMNLGDADYLMVVVRLKPGSSAPAGNRPVGM